MLTMEATQGKTYLLMHVFVPLNGVHIFSIWHPRDKQPTSLETGRCSLQLDIHTQVRRCFHCAFDDTVVKKVSSEANT